MAITYTSQQLRQLCQRSAKWLMRITRAVYYDLKQLGINHATPTHRGTTGGLFQRATKPIPVVVATARISRPTWLTRSNNILHTGAPSSNMNNLTHFICNADLPKSADKTVNTKFALINTRSVRNKADFIKDYIVEHHVDIEALTETWLSRDDKAEINVLRHFTSSSLTRFLIYVMPSICAPSRTLSIDSRLM